MRSPNCHFRICASDARPKIFPAVGESTVAVGWPKLTWLKTLKLSARNWPVHRSPRWKFLLSDTSALKKWGPKNESYATLPKVPAAGRLHGPRVQPLAFSSAVAVAVPMQLVPLVPVGATVNQPFGPGLEMLASPTRFGRHGPVSSSRPQSR